MLKSMTAFGRASAQIDGRDISVEIRSVNNRFLDCSVRMPRQLGFSDDRIKPYITSHGVTRGKLDVSISVDFGTANNRSLTVDTEYADAYVAALNDLRERYGLRDDISVMTVAQDRNVFTVQKEEADEEKDFSDVCTVLSEALTSFLEARQAEGARIEADLRLKIEKIEKLVCEIEEISLNDIEGLRERIEERLRRVLADLEVKAEESRVLAECAIYADRIAIDEELVRLRSHFKAFDDIMSSNEAAGRKLDFLMQEMNREINTIGSKCQNASAAQKVVDVKCELEKIREQIQNIE